MIAHRRIFQARPGRQMELVDLVRAGSEYGFPEPPHGRRVYWAHISSYNQVILEIDFESHAELEAYWDEWRSSPGAEEFGKKFYELTGSGGGAEIWYVDKQESQ